MALIGLDALAGLIRGSNGVSGEKNVRLRDTFLMLEEESIVSSFHLQHRRPTKKKEPPGPIEKSGRLF